MLFKNMLNKFAKTCLLSAFFAFLIVFSLTLNPSDARAAGKYITIGTGGVTGVYYPAGGAICRLVNRGARKHGIRCSVESTAGSIYNLNAVRAGELDIAVAQSDWQYHAVRGTGPFRQIGGDKRLRSLFSLHTESFTILARADSKIYKLNDLRGKRVNIGDPGSGNRATMEVIMDAKGWNKGTFRIASELKASEQAQALCDDKVDAVVYSYGHPNGAVQEATTTCNVRIIPVVGTAIDKLVQEYPYYAYSVIPGGMYRGNPDDVKTFGVKATFVSSTDVGEDVIYDVVKSVFENFENFKNLHPVFSTLNKRYLVLEGNSAPLHKGAIKYFKEADLY